MLLPLIIIESKQCSVTLDGPVRFVNFVWRCIPIEQLYPSVQAFGFAEQLRSSYQLVLEFDAKGESHLQQLIAIQPRAASLIPVKAAL